MPSTYRLLGSSFAIITAILAASLEMPAAFASIYTGTIWNTVGGDVSDGDLIANGRWDAAPAAYLTWVASDNFDGTWHYKYIFSHPEGDTSHIILEASQNVVKEDVKNPTMNGLPWEAHVSVGPGGGNPDIPGSFTNEIRFDETTGTVTTIEFDINRVPTWGDFYAKDGGNNPVDTAWNSGFTLGEVSGADPIAALQDGPLYTGSENEFAHILVPDTHAVIPEPTTLVIWFLLGALGIAVGWWRRRRSLN
jgi:hypothetical protein